MLETHKIEFATRSEEDGLTNVDEIRDVIEYNKARMVLLTCSCNLRQRAYLQPNGKRNPSKFEERRGRVTPKEGSYGHEIGWHDRNGHSHIWSAILGVSLAVPFAKKDLFWAISNRSFCSNLTCPLDSSLWLCRYSYERSCILILLSSELVYLEPESLNRKFADHFIDRFREL